jgi:hypothetical protein
MEINQKVEEPEEIESEQKDEEEETTDYQIITYGADYTISVLHQKLKQKQIRLPDYQRRFVWKLPQASKLIESFLLGLPVPQIFLSKEKETGDLLVVDGQQRLSTILAFKDGKFPSNDSDFRLADVNKKFDGKTYEELPDNMKRKFDDSVLKSIIIEQIQPDDGKTVNHIFRRLNTGGTPLTSQEVRNCVYAGKFNLFLQDLNTFDLWRRLYSKDENSEINYRMKDIEFILRFFALYYDFEAYKKPMNEFLDSFMWKMRNADEKGLEEMGILFKNTVTFIYEKLTPDSLRPRTSINIAVFDSIMYVVAKHNNKIKKDISYEVIKNKLFDDRKYMKATREGTTDPEVIKERFEIVKKYLVD